MASELLPALLCLLAHVPPAQFLKLSAVAENEAV